MTPDENKTACIRTYTGVFWCGLKGAAGLCAAAGTASEKTTAQKKSRCPQPDEELLEFHDAIDSGHLPNYNEDRGKQKARKSHETYVGAPFERAVSFDPEIGRAHV